MGYADSVMDVSGRIPLSWVNQARVLIMAASVYCSDQPQKSKAYKRLSVVAEPAFLSFIKDAHETSPTLFRPDEPGDLALLPVLFRQLCGVFSAHERLMAMNKSTQKYSESDYAANV